MLVKGCSVPPYVLVFPATHITQPGCSVCPLGTRGMDTALQQGLLRTRSCRGFAADLGCCKGAFVHVTILAAGGGSALGAAFWPCGSLPVPCPLAQSVVHFQLYPGWVLLAVQKPAWPCCSSSSDQETRVCSHALAKNPEQLSAP